MAKQCVVSCDLVNGLVIQGINEECSVELPGTYTKECIPVNGNTIPRKETLNKWPHLQAVAKELGTLDKKEIGLLIGFNCSAALMPRKVVSAGNCDPYAVCTVIGWGVTGNMVPLNERQRQTENHFVHKTHVQEVSAAVVARMYDREFNEENQNDKISVKDRKSLEIVTDGIKKNEQGHYE